MRLMKFWLVLMIFLAPFAGAKLCAADRIYQLVSIEENADFDYKLLESIDGLTPPYPEDSSFMIGDIPTTRGEGKIYRLIAPFISQNHEQPDKIKVFHDLLAISVDNENTIADAWHYTLEWQDSPALKLYRLGNKGLKLTRYLNVQKLEMTNAAGESLESSGILDDCYDSRLHFPEAAPNEIVELSLKPDELSADDDQILFQPGSGIKKTAYTTYAFDKDEFEAKVGKLPLKKQRKIMAEIVETEAENYDPDNQMMQKPIGGFDLTRHLCSIVSVEK